MLKKMCAILIALLLLVGIKDNLVFSADNQKKVSGNLKVLTYNMQGLPSWIQGGNPGDEIKKISPLLNGYDLVGVQENFDYDAQLTESITLPYRNSHIGKVPFGNGLNLFSKYRIHTTREKTWFWRYGKLNAGSDELTPKGFTFSEVELYPGVYIHVYNLHADAGLDDGSGQARGANMKEVVEHIRNFSKDRAVIVMGDTNSYYFRDTDRLESVFSSVGLKDPMIELNRNGMYPQPLKDWRPVQEAMTKRDVIYEEVIKKDYEPVDKILYRSGGGVTFTPETYRVEFDKFSQMVNGKKERIRDHSPIYADLHYEIDLANKNTPEKVFLSDIRCESAKVGWGYFKPDSSISGFSHNAFSRITIAGQTFDKGLGTHANAELVYQIGGKYKQFSAYVGIDDEVSSGSVVFEVWGDGRKLGQSPVMRHGNKAFHMSINVENVQQLVLKTLDAGDENNSDHGDWGDATLMTKDYKNPGVPKIVNDTDSSIYYSGNFTYERMSSQDINGDVHRLRQGDAYNTSANLYRFNETDAVIEGYYAQTGYPFFSYQFTGTGIDYVGQLDRFNDNKFYAPQAESLARVYIDSQFMKTVRINASKLWPGYTLFSIQDLPYGNHTIKVEKISGEWMVLDGFRVYGSKENSRLINDNNGNGKFLDNLTLYGNWRISSNRGRGDYLNDVTESGDKNAAFEYRFYGTGIDYIAPYDGSNGLQRAFIDGQMDRTFDAKGNKYMPGATLYSRKNLPLGWHTLRVENIGSRWFRIDAFRIYE